MKLLLYDASNTRHEYNEPLGIEAIMGYLQVCHPDVQVDIMMWSIDGIPTQKTLRRYDVIGVSIPFNSVWIVREIYKNIDFSRQMLIFGNSISTFGYALLLEEFPQAICSLGEGEYTFGDLVTYLDGNSSLEQVRNIAFKRENKVVLTQRQDVAGSMIPCPARPKRVTDFLLEKKGTFRIEASRGCDYGQCTFCYLKGKYTDTCRREIPKERVIEQICYLSSIGVKNPYFTDEDFIGRNYERAAWIASRIIELKEQNIIDRSMHFYINIKATDVTKSWWAELFPLLLQAGVDQVFVGIESGTSNQLKRFHKPATVRINQNAVFLLDKNGFDAEIGFICFDPLVSLHDLCKNLDFIRDCRLYERKIYLFDCLRVTIGSEYYDITSDSISYGPLEMDTLSYSYKYIYKEVQEIWDTYSAWRQSTLERFYEWQLKTRGENSSKAVQEMLKSLNYLEYSIMQCLVQWKRTDNTSFFFAAKRIMHSYEALIEN